MAKETFSFEEAVAPAKVFSFEEALGEPTAVSTPAMETEVVTSARPWQGAGAGRGGLNDPRRLDAAQPNVTGSVLDGVNLGRPTVDYESNLDAMRKSASPGSVMFSPGRTKQAVDKQIELGELARQAGYESIPDYVRAQEDSERRQQFAEDNPNIGALASGLATVTKGTLNAIPAAAGFVNKTLVDPFLGIAGARMPDVPTAPGTSDLDSMAKDFMPAVGKLKLADAWDGGVFKEWLAANVSAQVPQIAQSVYGVVNPAAVGAILPMMGAQAAGGSFAEGDDPRVAVSKGIVEMLSEGASFGVAEKVKTVLQGLPSAARQSVLRNVAQKALAVGGALTAQQLAGAVEESVAQLGGNALDIYASGKQKSMLDDVPEAAVIGAAVNTAMALPNVAEAARSNRPEDQAARALARELNRGDLPPGTVETLNPNLSQPAITPKTLAGLTEIGAAASVDEAIIAAARATTPQAQAVDNIGRLLGDSANVSQPGEIRPLDSTSPGSGGVEPGVGLEAGVGTVDPARPALDAGSTPHIPTGDVAPLGAQQSTELIEPVAQASTEPTSTWFGRRGDGYQTEADAAVALPTRQKVAPDLDWKIEQMPSGRYRLAGYDTQTQQPASFKVTLNPTGTATIIGNPEAIKATLAQAGIDKVMTGTDRVVVGTSQAQAAVQALEQKQPPALVNTARPAIESVANDQNNQTREDTQAQAPTAQTPAPEGSNAPGAAAEPAAAGPAAVEADGVGKFDSLEDALTKERDGTTSEIESGWMDGKGRRQQTAIERAVYDAVTASTLDADAAAGIVETALKEGRADLALYAAQRAARAAESMSTTPGVSESSPKYEAIKNDLVKRKQKAQADAQTLIEKAAKGAAPATAPKTGDTITADGKPADKVRYGRNGTPLDEGGKPFKTKAQADAFRKANTNNMRTVKQGAGFVLRDLTAKELAAREKAAKRLAQASTSPAGVPIPAHAFIADKGGLAQSAMADSGFDRNMKVGNRWLFAGTGKPGLTLAEAAELLAEAGYIREESEAAAAEIIKRSIRTPQYTAEGWERIAEAELATRFEDHLAAQQEATEPSISPEDASILEALGFYQEDAATRALIDAAEAADIDTDAILEKDIQFTENPDYAQQSTATASADQIGQEPAARASIEQGRQAAQPGGIADGQRVPGPQGAARGNAEEVADGGTEAGNSSSGTLTAPTEADVLAQQDRREQADDLDQREQIQREAEGFQLQAQAPEQRKDNTSDMLGGPTADDVARARKPGKQQEDDGTEPMFRRGKKDEPRDLIIQHNLTAENLLHAERMGGIPVPSLAITKAAQPLENFGEITLLGDADMATPRGDMKVFGADIYSPRYPSITYRVVGDAVKKINATLAPYRQEGDREYYGGADEKLDDLTSYRPFKQYAAEKAGWADPSNVGWDEMKAAATKLFTQAGAEERIFQGFTDSGNRRYKAHTLDNVIAILKKELRGGESFNYGAGSLRAKFTPQFRTIQAIRNSKDRLITTEAFEKVKDEINNELLDLTYDMVPNGGFRSSDTGMAILEEGARIGMRRAAKEYDIELSDEQVERANEFLQKLRNLPTAYFEAKALRAMDLSEFKVAVVPDNLDADARRALEKRGVKIVTYPKGDAQARKKAIADASADNGLMFSRAQPFYSTLSKSIEGMTPKALPGAIWKDGIKGLINKGAVKEDEVEWSGVREWLDLQTGKVSKEDVLAYLDANGVQVQEVVLGDVANDRLPAGWVVEESPDEPGYWEVRDAQGIMVGDGEGREAALANVRGTDTRSASETKYSQYTLPGGTAYREVLLTLPERKRSETPKGDVVEDGKDAEYPYAIMVDGEEVNRSETGGQIAQDILQEEIDRVAEKKKRDGQYNSPHWSQPNVLAHIRVNDRTDADGNRVLFVEEIQSDWGQDGKRRGFNTRVTPEQVAREIYGRELASLDATDREGVMLETEGRNEGTGGATTAQSGVVPLAPFVTSTDKWLSLALKRIITMAAQEGYDRVAFVNGEQSAERYDLSKQVRSIAWTGRGNDTEKTVTITPNSGNDIEFKVQPDGAVGSMGGRSTGNEFDGKRLDEIVGKDVAERIMGASYGDMRGNGLKVGGEGMKAFYDKIVPTAANKLLAKLGGGKMETVELQIPGQKAGATDSNTGAVIGPNGTAGQNLDAAGFTITPAMREKASAGLPLFRKGADQTTGLTPTQFTQALSEAFGPKVAERLQSKGVVVPLADQTKLPAHVVPFLRDGDIVFGFYDPRTNRTYAVLENLTPDMVKGLAMHEVGVHYGFEAMLGADKYKQVMKQLDGMHKLGSKAVRAARAEAVKNAARPAQVPEETLAYLVQNSPELGLIKEVIAKIKAFLFREFGIGGKYLTEADLHMLAKAAVQHAARTEPGGVEVPAFMRQNEGMANQGENGTTAEELDDALDALVRNDLEDDQVFTKPLPKADDDSLTYVTKLGGYKGVHVSVRGGALTDTGPREVFFHNDDDEPIGFARLTKNDKRATISMIAFNEDARGNGYAKAFYKYLLDEVGVAVRSDSEITEGTAALYRSLLRDYSGKVDADGRVTILPKTGAPEFSRAPATDTKAFKDWFGDSKVVDADGKPLVVYHGRSGDFTEFNTSGGTGKTSGTGAFFTASPAVAATYTGGAGNSANIAPVYLRIKAPLVVDAGGSNWSRIAQKARVEMSAREALDADAQESENIAAALEDRDPEILGPVKKKAKRTNVRELFKGEWDYPDDTATTDDIARWARKQGFDGVIFHNVVDQGPTGQFHTEAPKAPSDLYVVFAPNQVKSATGNRGTFDPADPDIRFSRTNTAQTEDADPVRPELSPWRDATGRLQFAPGAWLWDKLGTASGPILNKLQLKAPTPELRRIMRQMKLDVEKAQEVAAAVAGEATKLTEDERAMVSDLIEKELKAGTVPPEHAVRLAALINASMESQTDELVRLGMLTKDSADKWRGQYLPRYYESKLTEKAGDLWADAMRSITRRPSAMKGIKGKHLRGRGLYETIPESQLEDYKTMGWEVRDPDYQPGVTTDDTVQVWRDFTRQERDKMGEIRDAGFRFVMGYMQTQKDIALGTMFQELAARPDMSSRTATEKMSVQVPTSTVAGTGVKTYGKLAGRWVEPETLSQLTAIEESHSDAMQMYRKAMSIWKEGKTVLNPVSHVNNTISNMSMAHFGGVSYHRADKYLAAMRDFAKKSPRILEAKEAGLFLGTLSEAELMNTLPEELKILAQKQESATAKVARSTFNLMTFYLRRPMGWAYQAEDTFFRYLLYKHARESGMEPAESVDYAQKYIFTYDDLPKGARRVRDFAVPFFAYTYKAIPALLHTALTHPLRMAGPAAVLWAANAAAYAIAAGDDEDSWEIRLKRYLTDPEYREKARKQEKMERDLLPDWNKGTTSLMSPKVVRLGNDELSSLPIFLDVSRIVPGGDLFDVNPNAGGIPLPQPITPSHPLFTSAVALLANRDLYFGKDLTDNNDTSGEKFEKRAAWIWKQMSPAIAANNYHWERGMNALAQATGGELTYVPDFLGGDATGIGRDGLPVQPGYAAMQTFGIKARLYDFDTAANIEQSMKNKMIRDIDTELRKLQRLNNKGALSDRGMEKARELAQTKKDRLREGLTVDGDARD